MIKNIYTYLRRGESYNFDNIEELNDFLRSRELKTISTSDRNMVFVSENCKEAVLINEAVSFFGLNKYGYKSTEDLTFIEFNGTEVIIDENKPAAFLIEKQGINNMRKATELSVSKEEDSGSFIRRIRVNGRKVSISTLVKKYNVNK